MIGLDTNVVVRYLLQDEPKQSQQANQVIEKAILQGNTLFICQVTLCEIIWVLEGCYDTSKKEIIGVLKQLLQTQQIKLEKENSVREALRDFENHSGVSFSDCLIGRLNASNQCPFTYTFDKKAAKNLNETFRLITTT